MRPISPQPKPVRAPKREPKPLRRGKPLERSWMRKGTKKTKHARRPREWGYMAFCHDRGCELRGDAELQRVLGIRHDCEGATEFAHLHDRRRYAPGDIGSGLCRDAAHQGIDGKIGGKAAWYAAHDYSGQHTIRMRLANRARMAWEALTPAQRAEYERKGEAWLASHGARR